MTRHLIELGHRRVGFVRGPLEHADAGARHEGYRKALSEAGIAYREDYCPMGHYAYDTGVRCGERLLALNPRPTAVFASNDDMAAGVMAASLRYDLSIPGDLSVAGFDDAVIAHNVSPRLTTCRLPVEDMVDAATAALIQPGGPRFGPILLPHNIIVRGSTGRPAIA